MVDTFSFALTKLSIYTWQEEIQVSYDVINLYPSISIDKGLTVLVDTLNNDLDDLNTGTTVTLTEIYKFTELRLNKSYFLYENKIKLLENAGPIGLFITYGSII